MEFDFDKFYEYFKIFYLKYFPKHIMSFKTRIRNIFYKLNEHLDDKEYFSNYGFRKTLLTLNPYNLRAVPYSDLFFLEHCLNIIYYMCPLRSFNKGLLFECILKLSNMYPELNEPISKCMQLITEVDWRPSEIIPEDYYAL